MDRRTRLVILAVASVVVLSLPPQASAQTSGATRPLSATVVATYVARNGDLTLLVLWRGSPGWYSPRAGGNGSGGGGNSDRQSFWLTYGGKTLTIDLNYPARTAQVLGQTISLEDAN